MRRIVSIAVFMAFTCPMDAPAQSVPMRTKVKASVIWRGTFEKAERPALIPLGVKVPTTFGAAGEAYAINNTVDFAKLWLLINRPGSFPDVDFTQSTVVVILGFADDVNIVEWDRQLAVDFRTTTGTIGGQSLTLAMFPRSSINALLKLP